MLKRLLAGTVLALALAAPALAQSTAGRSVPGYIASTPQSNCTGTQCFVQYGPTLPIYPAPATNGQTGNPNYVATINPPVTASAYSANNVIGGLQTVPIFRSTSGPTGLLTWVQVESKSGITAGITIYGFTKLPVSTCTDHSAFGLSNTDLPFMIPGFPIALTLATATNTTQSINSSGFSPADSVANADTTPSNNLYFCAVTTGTPSPASTTDLEFFYGMLRD